MAYINVCIIGSLAQPVVELLARRLKLNQITLEQSGITHFYAGMRHVIAKISGSDIAHDPRVTASKTIITTYHGRSEAGEADEGDEADDIQQDLQDEVEQRIEEQDIPVAAYLTIDDVKSICLAVGKRDDAQKSILVIVPGTWDEHNEIKSQVDNMGDEFKTQFDDVVYLNKSSYTNNPRDDEDFEPILHDVGVTMISLDQDALGEEASVAMHLFRVLQELTKAQAPEATDYESIALENSQARAYAEGLLDQEMDSISQAADRMRL